MFSKGGKGLICLSVLVVDRKKQETRRSLFQNIFIFHNKLHLVWTISTCVQEGYVQEAGDSPIYRSPDSIVGQVFTANIYWK